MSHGLFDELVAGESAIREASTQSKDALEAAVYDVRQKFGGVLFNARDLDDFRDRVALIKHDPSQELFKTINAHVTPKTGIVRRIVGRNGTLEQEFKARLARRRTADSYTVQPGDTLSGIAQSHGMGSNWKGLADANPGDIGTSGTNITKNPDLIHPGDKIDIPGTSTPSATSPGTGTSALPKVPGLGSGQSVTDPSLTPAQTSTSAGGTPPVGVNGGAPKGGLGGGGILDIPSFGGSKGLNSYNPPAQELGTQDDSGSDLGSLSGFGGGMLDKGLNGFGGGFQNEGRRQALALKRRRAAARRRADKTGPNLDLEETFDDGRQGDLLKPKGDWKGYLNKVDQGGPSKVQKDFTNKKPTSSDFVSGGAGPNFVPGKTSGKHDDPRRPVPAGEAPVSYPPELNRAEGEPLMMKRNPVYSPDGKHNKVHPYTDSSTWRDVQARRSQVGADHPNFVPSKVSGKHNSPWNGEPKVQNYIDNSHVTGDFIPQDEEYPSERARMERAPGLGSPTTPRHQARRRKVGADHLQKAQDGLMKVLNEQAENFQKSVGPLQQALQTIQQWSQQQNPMGVQPPAGTVNVLPGQPQQGAPAGPPPGAPAGPPPGGPAGPPPGGDPMGGGGAPPPGLNPMMASRGRRRQAVCGGGHNPPHDCENPEQHEHREWMDTYGLNHDEALDMMRDQAEQSGSDWDDSYVLPRGKKASRSRRPLGKARRAGYEHPSTKKFQQILQDHRGNRPVDAIENRAADADWHLDHGNTSAAWTLQKEKQHGKPLSEFSDDDWAIAGNPPQRKGGTSRDAGIADEWTRWLNQRKQKGVLPTGGPKDDEDFAQQTGAGPRALEKLHTMRDRGEITSTRKKADLVDLLGRHTPAQSANHKVAGWDWDDYLSGFVTTAARRFSCACGKQFPTPSGFHRCACGKQWNSYVIGSDGRTASADKFICREIPARKNVIVARQKRADWDADFKAERMHHEMENGVQGSPRNKRCVHCNLPKGRHFNQFSNNKEKFAGGGPCPNNSGKRYQVPTPAKPKQDEAWGNHLGSIYKLDEPGEMLPEEGKDPGTPKMKGTKAKDQLKRDTRTQRWVAKRNRPSDGATVGRR